jgi:hypothetical protein
VAAFHAERAGVGSDAGWIELAAAFGPPNPVVLGAVLAGGAFDGPGLMETNPPGSTEQGAGVWRQTHCSGAWLRAGCGGSSIPREAVP